MLYELEDAGDLKGASSKGSAPLYLMWEWVLLYFYLGMKWQVTAAVTNWCDERIVMKGHAVQKFSYLKAAVPNRVKTKDPEILALFQEWGLDPAVPLSAQVSKIKRAFESRQKAEKAEVKSAAKDE